MNTDRHARIALVAAGLLALGGCETPLNAPKDVAAFGEPNRQTMMAQVIDPDPQYADAVPPTSGEHAAQAIERHRTDKVKRPDRVRTTEGGSGGGRN